MDPGNGADRLVVAVGLAAAPVAPPVLLLLLLLLLLPPPPLLAALNGKSEAPENLDPSFFRVGSRKGLASRV